MLLLSRVICIVPLLETLKYHESLNKSQLLYENKLGSLFTWITPKGYAHLN